MTWDNRPAIWRKSGMTGEDIELIEHYKFRRGSLLAERRNRGYTLIHAQTGALSPGCAHPGAAIHSNSSTGLWESKPGRRSARSEKTVVPLEDALQLIAANSIFWAVL